MRTHFSQNRAPWYVLVAGTLAVAAAGASFPSRAAEDDGIVVERNESAGTITILVPSKQGRIGWNDVCRGLARASRLDDQALPADLDGKHLDLTERGAKLSLLALSAAVPDVSLRVIEHPVTREPALRIRFDHDQAQDKIRRVKSFLRDKLVRDGEGYGLRLDDRWDKRAAERPLVVLIHGYSAGRRSLDEFRAELTVRGWPCAAFSYPNDGPLARSGELLAEELSSFRERFPERRVVLVAHSMGGLVARVAIEDPNLDPGNVRGLIMVCTPNHGSRWAELPGGLDVWEHLLRQPEQTLTAAFRSSVADGLNEARADLKPQSNFLRELNSRQRHPQVRYSLILGTGSPVTAQQIASLRERVTRFLADKRAGALVLPRVREFSDGFDELESGKGDGVVSVACGRLEGVEDTVLLPMTHWTLSAGPAQPAYRKLCDAILERLEMLILSTED